MYTVNNLHSKRVLFMSVNYSRYITFLLINQTVVQSYIPSKLPISKRRQQRRSKVKHDN